jgi:LETM1 and EF-hand domain-containing protein 1, mitochondrial
MSLNRSAARVSPLLRGVRTTSFRRQPHSLPRNLPAIAILLPRRTLATETSTTTGPAGNFPPPGFNAEQAKKPLATAQSNEKQVKPDSQEKATAQGATSIKDIKEDVKVPQSIPTSSSKSVASEARALSEFEPDSTAGEKGANKKVATGKEDEKKLTLWQKVKKEVNHYWDGTKLLGLEVRISTKLALKMAAGYELTRRENRQVCYGLELLSQRTLLTQKLAPTHSPRSWSFSPFLGLHHCAIR